MSFTILNDLVRRGKLKFEYFLPVGHTRTFHCITVFSGYTASSTLTVTCVTLTDLTDGSLVKISVIPAKFRSRRWQKSFSSKIFQNFLFYSDNFRLSKFSLGIEVSVPQSCLVSSSLLPTGKSPFIAAR